MSLLAGTHRAIATMKKKEQVGFLAATSRAIIATPNAYD
jgi:hypothetical protein